MARLREILSKINQIESRLANLRADKSSCQGNIDRLENQESRQKKELQKLEEEHYEEVSKIDSQHLPKKEELFENLSALLMYLDAPPNDAAPPRLLSLPWHHPQWLMSDDVDKVYQTPVSGPLPRVLRLGEWVTDISQKAIPALVPTLYEKHSEIGDQRGVRPNLLLMDGRNSAREDFLGSLQSIALRLASTFPARQVKLTLIDPINMGSTFPFRDLNPFISGDIVFTSSDDIEHQLRQLTIHIQQVVQNYLGNDYENIEEYNAAAPIAEPCRYLLIADFPQKFSRRALDDLQTILSNGSKAGVGVVLHCSNMMSNTLDRGTQEICSEIFAQDSLLFGSHVTYDIYKNEPGKFRLTTVNNHISSSLTVLDQPPSPEQFSKIITLINQAFKAVKPETVSFTNLVPEPLWSKESTSELRAPIGVKGARAQDNLEFWMGINEDGRIVSNGLLAGKPGSGKSFTLHAIILGLSTQYSPDELELYLLDFKEGVEFQIYADPLKLSDFSLPFSPRQNEDVSLPHARVISIESDREFGLSVLEYINQQIEARSSLFKRGGFQNLQDYRENSGQPMSRILVIIDEFQYMFQKNDQITTRLNVIMENITRQGRAFGIHLMLASQSPSIQNLNRIIYQQVDLRMVQQIDGTAGASVLAEGNTGAIKLLDRPGKVLYNHNYGNKESNEIGQVANVSSSERCRVMQAIINKAHEDEFVRDKPLIIFNGSEPSRLSQNQQLQALVKQEIWLPSRELNRQVLKQKDWIPQESPSVVWLGESMSIGNHAVATFRRRAYSNMILVGTSEEIIFGILNGIVVSLVHCLSPAEVQFKIIDLSMPDEESPWSQALTYFRDYMGSYFPISLAKRFPEPSKKILKPSHLLDEVYEAMVQRLNRRNEDPDTLDFGETIFFIYAFGSLGRAQSLRPVIGSRDREEMSEDVKKITQIISHGPELGIHTILWAEDIKTVMKLNCESRAWLSNFDLRVALSMPEQDSRMFLGEPDAKDLERLRGYYYDASSNQGFQKFKPYVISSKDDLTQYSENFRKRFAENNLKEQNG